VAWQGSKAVRAGWAEYRLTIASHEAARRPDDAAALGLVDVAFAARDRAPIRGWYLPSRTGAAVVFAGGSSAPRAELVPQARALAAVGAGALLFDWPGTGESGGAVAYGAPERAALEGALDFLGGRPDVDPRRVGVYAFSMGGAIAVQVAAADPRVRALVLAAAPGDLVQQTRAEYAPAGRAAQWGALAALRLARADLWRLRPRDLVAAVAPRPLVVVVGTDDRTVAPDLARQLYDAAREPKELWVIDGAGHGGYDEVDPTYSGRVAAFFADALGAPAR
jgi:pimeloyl-ACP methyl ester carboxylesterase